MWITNVHKIYHCKVYGYTYIEYIHRNMHWSNTSFFFLKYLMGNGEGKMHINSGLCTTCVYSISLCAFNVLGVGKENSWGTIRLFGFFARLHFVIKLKPSITFCIHIIVVPQKLLSHLHQFTYKKFLSHKITFPEKICKRYKNILFDFC